MARTRSTVADDEGAVPTAFVSYAHGDVRWDATVLDFATALRTVGGIEADLDKWHVIGGQDWTTYGPSAIRSSGFILLAVSPAYKDAWEATSEPGRNPGVMREAAAIKTILEQDHIAYKQRVKLVLLPGIGTESVPDDCSMLERFEVTSFDLQGLEMLLRSILGKPLHPMPERSPLPPLPPHSVAPTGADSRRGEEPAAEAPGPAADAAGDVQALVKMLTERLEKIEAKIASREASGESSEGPAIARLQDMAAALRASIEAILRAPAPIDARQRMVGNYLNAQLYISAGAFGAADTRLTALSAELGDSASFPEGSVLEPCLRQLTDVMIELNERMRTRRHTAGPGHRHPEPPEMHLGADRTRGVRAFYEVARYAMQVKSPERSLDVIRKAILRGRTPPEKHAARLYARYTEQQEIAYPPLELEPPSARGDPAAAHWLAWTDLHDTANSVASDVLVALAKAHLEIHLVERRRSGPVGAILDRGKADIDEDRDHLRRSIVLNTFALSISEALPWIFAADASQRAAIQSDPARTRRELSPHPATWHARQVTLLALYRRSHGFRLLGDHERSYNDLRMVQRIGRLTRSARKEDGMLTGWVDTLEALAEYRIGELYRADHDYMQALVHLCRSHDSVQALRARSGSVIASELGHFEIKLSLGKGKAFFEIGAMKRSLKWHLTAWRWLLALESRHGDLEQSILGVERELDLVKHDPVLYKADVEGALGPLLERMVRCDLEREHHALAADILVRISHLLTVLRLPEDGGDQPPDVESSVLRCLKRAAELDEHNLLAQTGLLRYEMRRGVSIPKPRTPDPLSCWPSGASDVDQVIRAAEHLMLERLHAAGGPTGTRETGVAQALMAHFMTHTDSINLRGAILHRYLMRRRADEREPWHAEAYSKLERDTPDPSTVGSAPYLEFVCLRRFGSFTPFMPRPAAVSAVGGGYLVRIVRSPQEHGDEHPKMFNVVVDPGEGAVNNLYAVGLSIADIDMVVATHDHPEHLAALDAILSLRREFQDRERVKPAGPGAAASGWASGRRLLILGNRSVVNRYSFLNGDGHHLVQHLADASVLGGRQIPSGLTIDVLPTMHRDLGGHDATGFVLGLTSGAPGRGDAQLRIAFMADTAIAGLHENGDRTKPIDKRWRSALESDIVVAHVSDVPSGELRALAQLPAADDEDAIVRFDAGVRKLAAERPADASQLMHALSLVPPDPGVDPQPVSLLSAGTMDGGEHLYLRGLLAVCDLMAKAASPVAGCARILIVGELKEQLGSFRGTIAREINRRMLGLDAVRHGATSPPLIALTADIGLRIRLTSSTTEDGAVNGKNTVLCSTCSYNNDRLDMERFHPPQDIYEVCVKGDHEAMYWNCDLHDPGLRVRAMFVEQMGGYNPFAAGGRYHG